MGSDRREASGVCAHPDCDGAGKFRAPASPQRPGEFYRFCLKHVREYNAAWDFCSGMDRHAVEAQIRDDTVWNRPTWPLGGHSAQPFRDPFGMLGEDATAPPATTPAERRALATLGLEPPVSRSEVSRRYRFLAKKLHPDANGGDKRAEERLKSVTHAYATLRNSSRLE